MATWPANGTEVDVWDAALYNWLTDTVFSATGGWKNDWFDQAVKTNSSPTFGGANVSAGSGGLLTVQKVTEVVTVAKSSSSQASSTINLLAGAVVLDVAYKVIQSIDGTSPPTNWNAFWTTKDAANHDAVMDNVGVAVAAGKSQFVASGSGGGDGTYTGPYALPQANTLTIETTDGADNPTIVPADSATDFQVRVQVYYVVTTPPTG
jgi:hypothetical protein